MPAALCALISAALFLVSAGTIGWWWAMWLAPVPLLYLAFSDRPTGGVIGASFAAYAVGQATLVAAYHSFIPVPLLASVIALLALRFTVAVVIARFAARRLPALLAVLAFPAALTALEFATSQLSQDGSFGAIAYSQAGAPWLIQSATYFGLWSVTFLVEARRQPRRVGARPRPHGRRLPRRCSRSPCSARTPAGATRASRRPTNCRPTSSPPRKARRLRRRRSSLRRQRG
ncbi:MAG: hypothetical protein U1E87_08400 [Alphaproteobacteria bacterium]